MTMPSPSDPLRTVLRRTEAELTERLHEACQAEEKNVSDEPTGELLRLKESLLSAAEAADEVVALRQSRRARAAAGAEAAGRSRPPTAERQVPELPSESAVDTPAEGVREFGDSGGRVWRAWAVKPGRAAPLVYSEQQLHEYEKGWLAFEALDGTARKRLRGYPSDWIALDNRGLELLLRRAVDVPVRRSDPGGSDISREPQG